MTRRLLFRIVSGAVMAPAFLLSVLVQLNDPDPVLWMLMYAGALALAVAAAVGRPTWRGAAVVSAIAAVWALTLLPSLAEFVGSDHESIAFYMKTGDALEEKARECGGLLLVFVYGVAHMFHARFTRAGGGLPPEPIARETPP